MSIPLIDIAIERFADKFAEAVSGAVILARKDDYELAAATACERELKIAAEQFADVLARLVPQADQTQIGNATVSRSRTVLADRIVAGKSSSPRTSAR